MKNKFFYPTKRNVLIGFVVAQLFPVILFSSLDKSSNVLDWLMLEAIIIASLCMWRVKPDHELDEREINILFKWKSRMLDYASVVVILPLAILCLKPEISGWTLFIISSVPVYTLFTLFSLLAKKDLGYFFYESME